MMLEQGTNWDNSKQTREMIILLVRYLFVATSNTQISAPVMGDLYQYLMLITSPFLKLSLPLSHASL